MKILKPAFVLKYSLFILFLANGCCFPGSLTKIHDDGIILWQGLFPHDFNERDQIKRKNSVLVIVKNKSEYFGSLESRNKNLKLVFVNSKNEEIEIWKYVDYSTVEKITFSESENILRIYFDRSIMGIRNKKYAVVFNTDTMEKKTLLLECGKWCL